jgi:pimeloyl-ACP methyl ester carboxylesterase
LRAVALSAIIHQEDSTFSRLSQPVLNLWGEDDPCRPISSPAIIAALPKAEVETVALSRCGHFWHECPEQFFVAMQAFLGRVAAAR